MEMVAQIYGLIIQTEMVLQYHVALELPQHMTMRTKKMERITTSRQQLPVLAVRLRPKILFPLTLSVLLVGNYLTVARVGIIMINLDHGIISSTNMKYSTAA